MVSIMQFFHVCRRNLNELTLFMEKSTDLARPGHYPLSTPTTGSLPTLLASAGKTFHCWVSEMQRGFLHGRSMLGNVVDVDIQAMTVSLQEAGGAVVLFDFAAASPSMSHDYLSIVLAHLGPP